MMLPELKEQECDGDYNFNVRPVCTKGFLQTFGENTAWLISVSLQMIWKLARPDYLQVFTYEKKTYYCISDFREGETAEDYEGIEELYCTFLLPEER